MDKRLLIRIARHGLFLQSTGTTSQWAKEFSTSQQTISRKLRLLAERGLIELNANPSGFTAKLTDKGVSLLQEDYQALQRLFSRKDEIEGKYFIGLGEGKYYITRYHDRLKKVFGFSAFPGTLNIQVDPIALNEFLIGKNLITVPEFSNEGRVFGAVDGLPATVNGIKAAILFPKRTSHPPGTIECIAPVNLSKKLGLTNGSIVTIRG